MVHYPNKYQAYKNKHSDEIAVKVEGGYLVMTHEEYHVWKNQK